MSSLIPIGKCSSEMAFKDSLGKIAHSDNWHGKEITQQELEALGNFFNENIDYLQSHPDLMHEVKAFSATVIDQSSQKITAEHIKEMSSQILNTMEAAVPKLKCLNSISFYGHFDNITKSNTVTWVNLRVNFNSPENIQKLKSFLEVNSKFFTFYEPSTTNSEIESLRKLSTRLKTLPFQEAKELAAFLDNKIAAQEERGKWKEQVVPFVEQFCKNQEANSNREPLKDLLVKHLESKGIKVPDAEVNQMAFRAYIQVKVKDWIEANLEQKDRLNDPNWAREFSHNLTKSISKGLEKELPSMQIDQKALQSYVQYNLRGNPLL
jgi:hypothetical protein